MCAFRKTDQRTQPHEERLQKHRLSSRHSIGLGCQLIKTANRVLFMVGCSGVPIA